MIKIGIIQERNSLFDKRVIFSPSEIQRLQLLYPNISIKVESSNNRCFSDEEYIKNGIEVDKDISDCEVFFGIKAVSNEYLISNKSYFFFSHTLKKQILNRKTLQDLLKKNVTFYDYEAIVNEQGERLVGFGNCAGFLGVYNSLRAFGVKFELFKLPKAETLSSKNELIAQLKRLVLPPIKIVCTGSGKVGNGVKEILKSIKIKEVSIENYLTKKYTQAVFTQIDVLDYNIRKDQKVLDANDFYSNPNDYDSNLERFTKVSDILICGHYHQNGSSDILTQQMLNAKDCKLKVVGDISCDLDNSIACSLRSSSIEDPFYGYLPFENREVDVFHPAAIVVMAIDNLPNQLPRESSQEFGAMFAEKVVAAFFNGDNNGILNRAKVTENGKLTPKFSYLQDFVDDHA